jgi:hypothetical protein
VSLLQEPRAPIVAGGPDLWQFWGPILFFYGITACAFLVILPLLYGLVRIGKRLDRALGIGSEPPPIAADELPAKVAEVQRTMVRRGVVIAGVFDAFVTPFALLYVVAYVTHYQVSLSVAALYGGIGLLAAAGYTALWIVPIGITANLAVRANLRHRVQRMGSPS